MCLFFFFRKWIYMEEAVWTTEDVHPVDVGLQMCQDLWLDKNTEMSVYIQETIGVYMTFLSPIEIWKKVIITLITRWRSQKLYRTLRNVRNAQRENNVVHQSIIYCWYQITQFTLKILKLNLISVIINYNIHDNIVLTANYK